MNRTKACSFCRKFTLLGLFASATAIYVAATAHAQSLYISDDNGVEKYDFSTSSLSTLVPTSGDLFDLTGVTIGPNGNLFVAATAPTPQIYQYNATTGAPVGVQPFVNYEGTPPSPDPHDVINPQGMRFSPTNNNLYVADVSGATANAHIYDGITGASIGALGDPTLDEPSDVAFDKNGNLYVVNPGFENILTSAHGTDAFMAFTNPGDGGVVNPTALTFGPDGKLYVLDISTDTIDRFNANGTFDKTLVSFGLFQPTDLAFGPDGKLYVSGTDSGFGYRRSAALHDRRCARTEP